MGGHGGLNILPQKRWNGQHLQAAVLEAPLCWTASDRALLLQSMAERIGSKWHEMRKHMRRSSKPSVPSTRRWHAACSYPVLHCCLAASM